LDFAEMLAEAGLFTWTGVGAKDESLPPVFQEIPPAPEPA
jgi:hypothetical protein